MKKDRKFIFTICLLIVFGMQLHGQNRNEIDSLNKLYRIEKMDTIKVQLLNNISKLYWFFNPDTAILISEKALVIAKKSKYLKGEAGCYNSIGACNIIKSNLPIAIDNFLNALNIGKVLNDSAIIALQYQNIGVVYNHMGNYEEALVNYKKSLEIAKLRNYPMRIMANTLNIAGVYKELRKFEQSLEYSLQSLSFFPENNKSYEYATVLVNVSTNYMELKNDSLALKYAERALILATELNDISTNSTAYFNFGWYYCRNGEIKKGIEYFEKSLALANESGELLKIARIEENLAIYYKQINNLGKALEYFEHAKLLNDSILNIEKNKEINGLQLKFEREQTEKDKIIAQEKATKQNIILLSISIIAGLLVFIITYVYRRLQLTRRQKKIIETQNVELENKNEEITAQSEEISTQRDYLQELNTTLTFKNDEITAQSSLIHKQNNDIKSSITYASKIQNALITPVSEFDHILPQHFILFKPRDIVSGDFYWVKKNENFVYIAVADCTGHGVPGAFMSMLGISQLNEIVSNRTHVAPNLVLNQLRTGIKQALHQTNQKYDTQDGMDMAFCVLNLETNLLSFSGAYNPLYLIRESELVEYKADRMPIGIHPKDTASFTATEIQLQKNDRFYLFSDGYVSQFGGQKEEKFKSNRFKELLLKIHNQPFAEQLETLNQSISVWQGSNAQTDDMLVMGVGIE